MAMKSIPHDLAVELEKLQIPNPPTSPAPALVLIEWAEKALAMIPPDLWKRLEEIREDQQRSTEPDA